MKLQTVIFFLNMPGKWKTCFWQEPLSLLPSLLMKATWTPSLLLDTHCTSVSQTSQSTDDAEDVMYLGWDPFEVYGQALWWSRRSIPQCLICKLCVLTPTVTSELIQIRCFSSLPRTQHDLLNSTPRSEIYKTRHLHTIIYTFAMFLAGRTKLTSLSLTPIPQTYLNNCSDHNGPPRSRLF